MNRDNRPTLPPAEMIRIRKQLSLTRDQFAIEIGYEGTKRNNATTIRRFEGGARGIPLSVAKLIWLIGQRGLPEQWPSYLEANLKETS
jgi:transcriptional regulator with XRE-family HTH domain